MYALSLYLTLAVWNKMGRWFYVVSLGPLALLVMVYQVHVYGIAKKQNRLVQIVSGLVLPITTLGKNMAIQNDDDNLYEVFMCLYGKTPHLISQHIHLQYTEACSNNSNF